jgi:methylisocitrate lyase
MSYLVARCKLFRELLAAPGCLMLPGAFNGMVGRLAAEQGYQGLYISGAALTASSGVPDIGLRHLGEFTKLIKEVSCASNLPVLVDADTGFG